MIVDGEMKLEPETLLKALAYILGTSGVNIIYKRKHGIGTGTLYLQSRTLEAKMAEVLVLRGTMRAHSDMVTAIATPIDNSDMIDTSSRGKSIILWHLTKEDKTYGVPRRRITGHSHFVQDVVLSSDGLDLQISNAKRNNANVICMVQICMVQ